MRRSERRDTLHNKKNQTHNVRSIWTTRQNQLIEIQMFKSRHSEPLLRTDWTCECVSAVRNVCYIRRVRPRARSYFFWFVHSFAHLYSQSLRPLSLDFFFLWLSLSFSSSTYLCMCFSFFSHTRTYNHVYNSSCVSLTHHTFGESWEEKWKEKKNSSWMLLSARAGITLDSFYLDDCNTFQLMVFLMQYGIEYPYAENWKGLFMINILFYLCAQ